MGHIVLLIILLFLTIIIIIIIRIIFIFKKELVEFSYYSHLIHGCYSPTATGSEASQPRK